MAAHEVRDRVISSGCKGHPDVAIVTVDDVISHPWEVGDEDVMSACLGAFEVVPEGRTKGAKGEGEGKGKGEGEGH